MPSEIGREVAALVGRQEALLTTVTRRKLVWSFGTTLLLNPFSKAPWKEVNRVANSKEWTGRSMQNLFNTYV